MTSGKPGNGSFLKVASDTILAHLETEDFGVSELARALGMSRSNLHRKVHALTGHSVSRFMREVRLGKALELLKESDLTVAEVAYRVGFGSATYFSKCFHDHFGYSPGEAAKRSPENSKAQHSHTEKVTGHRNRFIIKAPYIISGVAVIAAALLLIITFKTFSGKHPDQQYIMAVLPIHNDSPDQENNYIVNSLMEEIMTKLSSLDGLAVVSRTTSEAYRNSKKSLPQIGKELQADYILEGSITFLNNNSRIRLQLIKVATDSHVWSEPYERLITEENLFRVQEDVALAVARELNLVLNHQQQKEIERKPTENMEAYQAYLLAKELLENIKIQENNLPRSQRMRAKELLKRAIALDSTFCEAYGILGKLYLKTLYKFENEGYSNEAYALLDTGLYYTEKLLSFYNYNLKNPRPKDYNYTAALILKGRYYGLHGAEEESQRCFNEAYKYNQMTKLDYKHMATWCAAMCQYLCSLGNYFRYLELKPSNEVVTWYAVRAHYNSYRGAGFPELARQECQHFLELDADSINYYTRLSWTERCYRNYGEAIRYMEWVCQKDSTNAWYWSEASRNYFFLGEKEKAVQVILERVDRLEKVPSDYRPDFVIGYVYRLAGMKEKGDSILQNYIRVMSERCRYPLQDTQVGYNTYNVARAYSILGNREKTLEYLEPLKEVQGVDIYLITELEDWPTLDLVRDTPEFQQILSTLKKRFYHTHEQIVLLLKNRGIDPA